MSTKLKISSNHIITLIILGWLYLGIILKKTMHIKKRCTYHFIALAQGVTCTKGLIGFLHYFSIETVPNLHIASLFSLNRYPSSRFFYQTLDRFRALIYGNSMEGQIPILETCWKRIRHEYVKETFR